MWFITHDANSLLLLSLAFAQAASAYNTEMFLRDGTGGYQVYEGDWVGDHANLAAETAAAYKAVALDAAAKPKVPAMVACTHYGGRIYCASSAIGQSTRPPFPADLEPGAKATLRACAANTGTKGHNQGGRCAEVFLMNLLLWDAAEASTTIQLDSLDLDIHAFGTGADPTQAAKVMKTCLAKTGKGTFGCTDMVAELGWWSIRDPPKRRSIDVYELLKARDAGDVVFFRRQLDALAGRGIDGYRPFVARDSWDYDYVY
jgi:hypothetical protein